MGMDVVGGGEEFRGFEAVADDGVEEFGRFAQTHVVEGGAFRHRDDPHGAGGYFRVRDFDFDNGRAHVLEFGGGGANGLFGFGRDAIEEIVRRNADAQTFDARIEGFGVIGHGFRGAGRIFGIVAGHYL